MWLSGIHIPESYLTALVQATCRKNGWPLDKSTLYTQVTTFENAEDVTERAHQGFNLFDFVYSILSLIVTALLEIILKNFFFFIHLYQLQEKMVKIQLNVKFNVVIHFLYCYSKEII